MSDNAKLPVVLTLQVGTVEIPLASLLDLHPDTVLEPETVTTHFPKVRAVVGNRPVAEGELVTIDNQVGFRVTKLL